MDAIYGIINKNGAPVTQADISAMQQALAHRGAAFGCNGLPANVVIGFCGMPEVEINIMPLADEALAIAADACFHNRTELTKRLDIDHDVSDAVLLLTAYKKWGTQCVSHLDGEYVFAVWDKARQQLFIATDHIGFKPVYYYDSPSQFIFCSEIKGIEAVKHTPNYFNDRCLIEYFLRQGQPNETYNTEIFSLLGASTLILINRMKKISKYWILKNNQKYRFKTDADWYECLRELLIRSVEKRLIIDEPVGITLSGGLDSSTIAVILSSILAKKNKPLYAFSSVLPAGYAGVETDERHYIALLGKHCPNIIQTWVPDADGAIFNNIERSFKMNEVLPNAFSYMDLALLEKAAAQQVKTFFNGTGGDFWVSFGGADVIRQLINSMQLKTAFNLLQSFALSNNQSTWQSLKTHYIARTAIYKQYQALRRKQGPNWQSTHTTLLAHLTEKYPHTPHFEKDNSIAMMEFVNSGRMGNINRVYANRNSWFNIAPASPFLDKDINEFMVEVPIALYVKSGQKRDLIRQAMKDMLPGEIGRRKDKKPFTPAFNTYMLTNQEFIKTVGAGETYRKVFEKYIDKSQMLDHISAIKIVDGFGYKNDISGIRIAQAAITCLVLEYLIKNGYYF